MIFSYTRESDRQMDARVVQLWKEGRFEDLRAMLPDYAEHRFGEGKMHDTAMLLGMPG